MSELKEYLCIQAREIENKTFSCYRQTLAVKNAPEASMTEVYLKSEADKVIAELKDRLDTTEKLLNKSLNCISNDNKHIISLARKNNHSNYKRCLAMAKWCEATALWCYQAANILPVGFHATLYGKPVMIEPARLFKRSELLTKWSTRWLELAEKFKN